MNNANRERVKRIIKCMKFQLIFNRLLINLQPKWLINGCSTYSYIYECTCVQLNGWIDMQTEAIRLTKVFAWRMDAAASAEQEISAITTHTDTHTQQRKGKGKSTGCRNWRNDSLRTLDMVTIIERASERGEGEKCMGNACKHLLEINKSTRRARCDQPGTARGGDMASEREKLYVASEVEIFA